MNTAHAALSAFLALIILAVGVPISPHTVPGVPGGLRHAFSFRKGSLPAPRRLPVLRGGGASAEDESGDNGAPTVSSDVTVSRLGLGRGALEEPPERLSFPETEEQILEYWDEIDAFHTSLRQAREEGRERWVFYDGPPFATGLPHYGPAAPNQTHRCQRAARALHQRPAHMEHGRRQARIAVLLRLRRRFGRRAHSRGDHQGRGYAVLGAERQAGRAALGVRAPPPPPRAQPSPRARAAPGRRCAQSRGACPAPPSPHPSQSVGPGVLRLVACACIALHPSLPPYQPDAFRPPPYQPDASRPSPVPTGRVSSLPRVLAPPPQRRDPPACNFF